MNWESWKQEHGGFSEAEDAEKKRAWEATLAKVTAHNLKYDQGLVSYRLGMNKFAVQRPPLMSTPGEMVADPTAFPLTQASQNTKLPESVDYRVKGWVTSMKDQGQCGSCYAFAAVGVMEAQIKRTDDRLVSLSTQQLVDCSDNYGCGGGHPTKCFEYAKNGLACDDYYPYTGKKDACQIKEKAVEVINWWLASGEDLLKTTVATFGPVAVTLHIPDHFDNIDNDKDIFDSPDPGTGWHAVLVVGYGTKKGVDYWIIKNSWGTGWGGCGYALLKRGVNLYQIGNNWSYTIVKALKMTALPPKKSGTCSIL